MDRAFLEQLLTGSGLLYVFLVGLVLAALVVRRMSDEDSVRRRAGLVVFLLALFAVLLVALGQIPQKTSGFVEVPGTDELVPGLIDNPRYVYVSVAALIVGVLAGLLTFTLLFVDFLLVGQLDVEIPNIVRSALVAGAFLLLSLAILSIRTGLDPTDAITLGGFLSIVIGLALQDTMGNFFSGLAIQTERSFEVGDWVRFGEQEGIVTDISWRTTKLRTRQNDMVIIPNTVISKDTVINYSTPTRIHAILATVGCHYRHTPAEVMDALREAAGQTEEVLDHPRPDIRTVAYGDFAIEYEIKYWIRDYTHLEEIQNAFMTRVWYAFSRRGIEIPYPIRNVNLREVSEETEQADREAITERIYRRLRRVDLFEALSEEETRRLSDRARIEQFFNDETVVRQGEPGDSLYIVDEGRVQVVVHHDGRSERLAELESGAILGEMALMTGAERTATIATLEPTRFFVIDREAFRETLMENPQIAEQISEILAHRRAELEETHAALHEAATRSTEEEKRRILGRIWEFFGFRGSEGGAPS